MDTALRCQIPHRWLAEPNFRIRFILPLWFDINWRLIRGIIISHVKLMLVTGDEGKKKDIVQNLQVSNGTSGSVMPGKLDN